ncbi:MAG: hypothetical protein ABIQ31_16940 [Ferruginibacter sp.]
MIGKEKLSQLGRLYTKSHLERSLLPLVKKYYLQKFFVTQKDGAIGQIIHKLLAKKQLNATEVTLLCFSVFENATIYEEFLSTLPKKIQLLIEKLLWVDAMTDKEAGKLLNEDITIPAKYSSYQQELKNEFYFFSVTKPNGYFFSGPGIFILSLHPVFKNILMEFYPKPVHYNFIQLDEIPATTHRFTAENSIIQELPKLISYHMQDGIKYSATGRPADATINKLQRHLGFTEFYTPEKETTGKARSTLMAGLIFNFKIPNINIDSITVIKELFGKQYLKLFTAQFILFHLKGWTYMNDSDFNKNAEHGFFEVLKQLPPGKWISAENLIDFIQYRFVNIAPVNSWALNNRIYFEKSIKGSNNSYIQKEPAASDANMLVNHAFIKGTIFLLASFGLIEIAYAGINTEKFGTTFYSAYDGLQYFRLTALGTYILGMSDSYEPAIAQQHNKLQFSEDSLMILAEGDMAVLDVMLARYAEKAGNNRFNVTHAHFLKDCSSRKDIERKIALFKKTIAKNLPVYWENQFKIWQENAQKITVEIKTLVYKIPADAKELQRLIAQDAVLKTLLLKAEQFYILIPVSNATRFKNRMKELGYIVE